MNSDINSSARNRSTAFSSFNGTIKIIESLIKASVMAYFARSQLILFGLSEPIVNVLSYLLDWSNMMQDFTSLTNNHLARRTVN